MNQKTWQAVEVEKNSATGSTPVNKAGQGVQFGEYISLLVERMSTFEKMCGLLRVFQLGMNELSQRYCLLHRYFWLYS